MKSLASFAIAVLAAWPIRETMAQSGDDTFKNTNCAKAQTQMELNYCADKDFQVQDKKLNALYRTVMSQQDANGQSLLKTAQRNWLAYRDSECGFETAGSAGGSIQPMEYSLCLSEKTKARVKELQAQRDCAEGDLTCNAGTKQ